MDPLYNEQEVEIMQGTNQNKKKNVMKNKLEQFEGPIEEFLWRSLAICGKKPKKNNKELKVYKRPKDDIDEEKQNDNDPMEKSVSLLLDFSQKELCPQGDWYFKNTTPSTACMECGSTEDVQYCGDCKMRDGTVYNACRKCRVKNKAMLQYQTQMEEIKSVVIRNELLSKPLLSLDLLCGLPRKKALDKLMSDILQLDGYDRQDYLIFLIDVDNLKSLNSALSHQGADKVIQQIGFILQRWCDKVNDGEVGELRKAYAFRQGGDEFAIVVKTCIAEKKPIYDFYIGWKKEINRLVKAEFMNEYKLDESALQKGKETLKERKKNQIVSALRGIKIEGKVKQTIFKAIEEANLTFSIEKIGISTGVFVGDGSKSKEQDWVRCAEMAQDAAKNMPGKNEIRIYYEQCGIIPPDKTKLCMKQGCAAGYL